MRLHFLRFSLIGSALLMLFMLTAGTAGAATRPHASNNRANLIAFPRHSAPVHLTASALDMSTSGIHYLYVDDGTCPDSIDVYKTGKTLTHVGNYPNDGCTSQAFYGASSLAVARANATHGNCLLYADGAGFIDSFVINSDGSLGAEVSHLATKTSFSPSNIAVAANGIAYETNPGYDLESYSVGKGCALTFLHLAPAYNRLYTAITFVGNTLATVDSYAGNIDSFHLGADGSIKQINSVASEFNTPTGVAIQTVKTSTSTSYRIYTGQATGLAPHVQGGKFQQKTGLVTFLKGSPATDPGGTNGASVTVDNAHKILIQGEQYSGTLANYSVKGSIAFLSETPMAVSGESPSAFVQLGSTLFVDMIYNGDVEACSLTSTGASGCKTVAMLTNISGIETGIAIL